MLIIEDDVNVRQLLEDELAMLGVRAVLVASGDAAIDCLDETEFLFVLADHHLNGPARGPTPGVADQVPPQRRRTADRGLIREPSGGYPLPHIPNGCGQANEPGAAQRVDQKSHHARFI